MGCFCWQHWKCFEDPDIRLGKVFFLWNMQWSWIEWTKSKSNKLSWMKGFQTWIWNNSIFNQTCAFRIRIHKRNLEKGTRIDSQDKNLYHSKLETHKHILIFLFKIILMGHDTNQKIIGLMVAWRNGRSLATCEKYRKVVLNWNNQY